MEGPLLRGLGNERIKIIIIKKKIGVDASVRDYVERVTSTARSSSIRITKTNSNIDR